MSKLKFSFLILMLAASVSAFADWAPVNVQEALKKCILRRMILPGRKMDPIMLRIL